MGRITTPGMRKVSAECTTCGWKCSAANAQGIAAQHADRHAGHEVIVEVLQYTRYTGT